MWLGGMESNVGDDVYRSQMVKSYNCLKGFNGMGYR